jgi:hypothetical protein
MAQTCRLAAILAADVAGYSRPLPPLCSALRLKSEVSSGQPKGAPPLARGRIAGFALSPQVASLAAALAYKSAGS